MPPFIEGSVLLPRSRRLGFAEFGVPDGRPVFWFHGTPGARRQIPPEARLAAVERGVRLIGIDRPGVGDSTAHVYSSFAAWARDIAEVADRLGVERFGLIGLSGGGPYVLACAHSLPQRIVAGAVLGGVAPAVGPDAAPGGLIRLAAYFEPVFRCRNSSTPPCWRPALDVWLLYRIVRSFDVGAPRVPSRGIRRHLYS